jgi:hypothetical protein
MTTAPLGPPVDFAGARPPGDEVLTGRHVRLEPLDPAGHGAGLWAAASAGDPRLWDYLPYGPFADEDAFLAWLCSAGHSHGELLAGQFLLGVWNPSTDWVDYAREVAKLPYPEHAAKFGLFEAIGIFDRKHVAALMAWIDAPFWP